MDDVCMPMYMLFCESLPLQVLWTWWNINDNVQLGISAVVCLTLGIIHQLIQRIRTDFLETNRHSQHEWKRLSGRTSLSTKNDDTDTNYALTSVLNGSEDASDQTTKKSVPWTMRLLRNEGIATRPFLLKAIDALIYGCQSALGYILMLIVMAMNGYLLAAIVLGEAIGVFVFQTLGGGASSCHS